MDSSALSLETRFLKSYWTSRTFVVAALVAGALGLIASVGTPSLSQLTRVGFEGTPPGFEAMNQEVNRVLAGICCRTPSMLSTRAKELRLGSVWLCANSAESDMLKCSPILTFLTWASKS